MVIVSCQVFLEILMFIVLTSTINNSSTFTRAALFRVLFEELVQHSVRDPRLRRISLEDYDTGITVRRHNGFNEAIFPYIRLQFIEELIQISCPLLRLIAYNQLIQRARDLALEPVMRAVLHDQAEIEDGSGNSSGASLEVGVDLDNYQKDAI